MLELLDDVSCIKEIEDQNSDVNFQRWRIERIFCQLTLLEIGRCPIRLMRPESERLEAAYTALFDTNYIRLQNQLTPEKISICEQKR